jgi:hypothetical protein
VKQPEPGFAHHTHLAPKLKKEQRYTSAPPPGLQGLFKGKLNFNAVNV